MEIEHPGVFVEETSLLVHRIEAVETSTAGFVGVFTAGPVLEPTVVHSAAHFHQLFEAPGVATYGAVAVRDFFAAGGARAVVVRSRPESGDATVDDLIEAVRLLGSTSLRLAPVQLLSIPEMARRTNPFDASDFHRLVQAAVAFVEEHHILLLIDPNTAGDELTDIQTWLQGNSALSSANSAVYVPQLVTPAGLQAGFDAVPASGSVAGVMARVDARRGIWKAPAGLEATIDAEIPAPMSDRAQSPLNRQGVNVIREFPAAGTVIWGSRTTAGSVGHQFRYVPVRRTALFIENSLRNGLDWVVFEPNGEPLWQKVRATVNQFLLDLWRQGAFAGTQPDEGFFVRCDRSTMSRVDLRRRRTIVQVGFAPLRPAEFVVVSLTLDRRER